MICTWFTAFWAKNLKWPSTSKEPTLGRQKSFSNRGDFRLKMIARTRRSRFRQYLQCFVHDFQRFGPKTQNGLPSSQLWAVKKVSQIETSLGSKWSRARVDHDSYNVRHVFFMISNVSGQKRKMAVQGANFEPSKNFRKSRRVRAQNNRENA